MNELKIIKQAIDESFRIDISKNKKTTEYVRARSIYYTIARELTPYSQAIISSLVGRDHSSVVHSAKFFERDIIKDKYYKKKYVVLLSSLAPVFETIEIDGAIKEARLIVEVKELKQEIKFLKSRLNRCIDPENQQEINFVNLWRSLDQEGKKDAMFKIETAKKVRERMRERMREQKRQIA